MKAYVISLRRATERRQYIEAHLQACGLPYEIVDAVDYQEMTPADFAKLTDEKAVLANPYLTKGVQACALSHAKVCSLIAASTDEVALVLEDDVALPANIKSILHSLEEQIGSEEIISLSYYTHFHDGIELSIQQTTQLINGSKLYYPVNLKDVGSAMAYVLPRAVAAKLSKAVIPVRVAADYWGDHYLSGAFASFRCLYPNPAQPATFRSTLDYATTIKSTSRQLLTALFSSAATIIRRFKLPYLYQFLEDRDRKRLEKKAILHFIDSKPFNVN
jgi:GR25 family glycosyltransferase involved in LPS biosynthesis